MQVSSASSSTLNAYFSPRSISTGLQHLMSYAKHSPKFRQTLTLIGLLHHHVMPAPDTFRTRYGTVRPALALTISLSAVSENLGHDDVPCALDSGCNDGDGFLADSAADMKQLRDLRAKDGAVVEAEVTEEVFIESRRSSAGRSMSAYPVEVFILLAGVDVCVALEAERSK